MQPRERTMYGKDHRNMETRQAEFVTIQDLLKKQTKGKIPLTRAEKSRIQKYEKETRNERKQK